MDAGEYMGWMVIGVLWDKCLLDRMFLECGFVFDGNSALALLA
jgi:hypothetical protein